MLDYTALLSIVKENGKVCLKEGSGKTFCLHLGTAAEESVFENGVYLLFDLFQIRTIAVPFSEVSLDIVEFASKPTIYQSPVNPLLPLGAVNRGMVRFSLIREPNWNKLLYQLAHPVLFTEEKELEAEIQTNLHFPLFLPGKKELFLGPEGEVKIRKG